jgi:hypothetical protein
MKTSLVAAGFAAVIGLAGAPATQASAASGPAGCSYQSPQWTPGTFDNSFGGQCGEGGASLAGQCAGAGGAGAFSGYCTGKGGPLSAKCSMTAGPAVPTGGCERTSSTRKLGTKMRARRR